MLVRGGWKKKPRNGFGEGELYSDAGLEFGKLVAGGRVTCLQEGGEGDQYEEEEGEEGCRLSGSHCGHLLDYI